MKRVIEHPNDFYDLEGEHLGVSEWMVIDQERINQFADATNDHQWIHVDPEKAKDGPFGGTIAHGYLTMSLVSAFMWEIYEVKKISMGVNYGTDKVRFPAPVPVNSRVRGSAQIISAEEVKGGIQVVSRLTVEIEDSERPACVVDTISRYFPEDA
ncbi:MAG: MaoC family dehydratase [Pseudomonadota bacterium]